MKRALLLLIIILGVAFRIWVSQPTWIHWDENYYINIFQNYVDRGELTPYMWRLGADTNIIAGSGTGYGIYVLIGWMLVFGESLFGVRMLMVLAGLITAWLYYLISKKWWESKEAGIAAMVFGLVSTSSFYTLVGRMDAIGILSSSLLLLLHITAVRQEKKWPHFWVGVVAILTTEFQILSLLYVGALALYYGVRYTQIVKSERKLVLDAYPVYFFLGAGLLGVIYILIHILPDPKAYFIIPSTCDICIGNRLRSLMIFCFLIMAQRPIEFILIIIILYSVIKYKGTNKHFIILLIGYFGMFIILNPPTYIQYYYQILPLISIGLAGYGSMNLVDSTPEKQESLKILFLLISLILLGINLMYFQIERFPYINAFKLPDTPEIRYIQENIPERKVIMASPEFFYPLRKYRNFLDYHDQIRYGLELRGEGLEEFFYRIEPEVLYFDQGYRTDLNEILQKYIDEKQFFRVTPDLWVTRELVP